MLILRHRVVASTFCLEKHPPKGSCHLDESSMNHTLAQNSHYEFWCGMHLTCKKHSNKTWQELVVTRGEKQCEGILSMSLLKATYPSEPSRYLSSKIATTVPWKKEKQKPIVRHAGSWLSRLPLTKNRDWNGRYAGLIRPSIPWLW